MSDAGLIFSCRGCCCGHRERGGPKVAPRALRAAVRRAFEASGLAGLVRLVSTDCLGPCSEANVVSLYLYGRAFWFRRMNSPALFAALLAYARAAVDGHEAPLPHELAERSFAWSGGIGPTPPLDAATS